MAKMPASVTRLPKRLKRWLLAKLAFNMPGLAERLLPHTPPLTIVRCCGDASNEVLLICLPGIADIAEDFSAWGFADGLSAPGAGIEVLAVDAHYGYYAGRTVLERLTTDVITPARRSGYREIWIAGISLGGFGALLYALRHPGAVTGVIVLAPYLGPDEVIREIAEAGGIDAWQPGDAAPEDHGRELWRMIKQQQYGSAGALDIYVGFGSDDPFAAANQLLGDSIPADHVFIVSGGHDWRTWKRLWDRIMAAWLARFPAKGVESA